MAVGRLEIRPLGPRQAASLVLSVLTSPPEKDFLPAYVTSRCDESTKVHVGLSPEWASSCDRAELASHRIYSSSKSRANPLDDRCRWTLMAL